VTNHINIQFYKTQQTEFILGSFDKKLCLLDFHYRKMRAAVDQRLKKGLEAEFVEQDDATLQAARVQIEDYFCGTRKLFDIPLLMVGSDFQKTVWQALLEIPYGETSSYLQLSKRIGNAKAVRAVAAANGANAISLIIPCHRIIGSNGALVGYGGGLPLKKRLLHLEQGADPRNITSDLFAQR
jgi:methylated-DNA-[protein]-cysteine S-methyltransferase